MSTGEFQFNRRITGGEGDFEGSRGHMTVPLSRNPYDACPQAGLPALRSHPALAVPSS